MSGSIGSDSLFLGLTRPPLIFGVSYGLAVSNLMISLMSFIITSKFIYLLVILPSVHGVFWMMCLKEPRAMELFMVRNAKCRICRNRMYHSGTNSYDVY